MGEKVAGCDESHQGLAAAELAGVEGGRSSPVNLLLGELYGEGLMSRECSEGLGVPFYNVTRLAPRRQKIRSLATTFL